MTLIFLIAVLLIVIVSITIDQKNRGNSKKINMERNDVVFLRRKFQKEYPNLSSRIPLRITNIDGKNITVTYMNIEKQEIYQETIMKEALKKVS
ncbi:MAG: hypothetical protein JWQ96_2720 [Segetibacter sp.]|nr:hypothetical protein [Segetibacter sp.]